MSRSFHVASLLSALALLICVFANGCGSYADFTLPHLPTTPDLELQAQLAASPVLERDGATDVLNPSVVRRGTDLYNFYSEFDGHTWHTALATSQDGFRWMKQGRVLSPDPRTWEGNYIAANGSALFLDGEFWYWFQAGEPNLPRIGLARSVDGRVWRREAAAVIFTGPRGSWDERGVADPNVLRIGNVFYAYYLGQDRARRQQLGLACSPDGIHWTKLRSNPVLSTPWPGSGQPDENGLGEPAVWQSNGWYWMIYTGRNSREQRALIVARSLDGVHWSRQSRYFSPPGGVSSPAWDSQVLCDPSVLLEAGRIRFWFGGGNIARPDENLNGQIGEGDLTVVQPGVAE